MWNLRLSGEGLYWWSHDTPIGTVDVSFNEREPQGSRYVIEWYPMDHSEPVVLGAARTEADAMAEAAQLVRGLADGLYKAATTMETECKVSSLDAMIKLMATAEASDDAENDQVGTFVHCSLPNLRKLVNALVAEAHVPGVPPPPEPPGKRKTVLEQVEDKIKARKSKGKND
jgi:hypothetical protein